MEAAIWGFIGTLVGAGVSIGTTFISAWKDKTLQEQRHTFDREEKARAFQRDNLLKLQDLLQKEIRFMGKVHFSDLKASKETSEWRRSLLSDDLDNEISINNRNLVITIERISNDELRNEIKDFRNQVSIGMFSKTMEESENRLHDASNTFIDLMEKVGIELRNNY